MRTQRAKKSSTKLEQDADTASHVEVKGRKRRCKNRTARERPGGGAQKRLKKNQETELESEREKRNFWTTKA